MRRSIALIPRVVAILFMGFLLVIMSTTFFSWWVFGPLRLQPVVIIIVSAGFRLPLIPGGLIAASLGHLVDLASGGPGGLQLTAFVFILCFCVLAERKLEINSWPFQMLAAGAMSFLSQLLAIGGIFLISSHLLNSLYLFLTLLAQAASTALAAPVFLNILDFLVSLLDRLWFMGHQAKK